MIGSYWGHEPQISTPKDMIVLDMIKLRHYLRSDIRLDGGSRRPSDSNFVRGPPGHRAQMGSIIDRGCIDLAQMVCHSMEINSRIPAGVFNADSLDWL
jgi:hypothetical protein